HPRLPAQVEELEDVVDAELAERAFDGHRSGRVRGEDVLQIERRAGVSARRLGERPGGVGPRHLLPRLHGLAVAMQARQRDAELYAASAPALSPTLTAISPCSLWRSARPGARVWACCSAVSAPAASPPAARPFAAATSASTLSGVSSSSSSARARASSARGPPRANSALTSPSRASARPGSRLRASR